MDSPAQARFMEAAWALVLGRLAAGAAGALGAAGPRAEAAPRAPRPKRRGPAQ